MLFPLIDDYIHYLHPLLLPSPLLFTNSKGDMIDHLSHHVQNLANQVGIKLPNATESRHVAASAIVRFGDEKQQKAVSCTCMTSNSTTSKKLLYS